ALALDHPRQARDPYAAGAREHPGGLRDAPAKQWQAYGGRHTFTRPGKRIGLTTTAIEDPTRPVRRPLYGRPASDEERPLSFKRGDHLCHQTLRLNRGTSRSSWMATAAGHASAACP